MLVVAVGAGAAVKVFKSVWWWMVVVVVFRGVGTVTGGHFPF